MVLRKQKKGALVFLVVAVAFLSFLCFTSSYLMQGLLFYAYAVTDQVQALVHDGYRDGFCAYAVAQLRYEIENLEKLAAPVERVCTLWNTGDHGFVTGRIRYEVQGPELSIMIAVLKKEQIVRSCRIRGVWHVVGKECRFTCVRIEDF